MGLLRWVPLIYTAIFTIVFVFIGLRSALVDLEPNNCKMTYMWPQYVPVKGMNHPKYDLYYYREGETKPLSSIPKLNGVPVLFIPGNAGSYRQVRSLGSVSAWTHSSRNLSNLHDSDLTHIKLQAPPVRGKKFNEFDFFTADFDEELTALNGDLLFNQIDFVNDCIKHILSLYHGDKGQKPTSVILVGHSMGGLVARGVFTAANYNPGSIKTIITINSPHRVDPLLFHRSSGRSYRIVNGFWKEELYNPDKLANSALKDVAVLSIAGGNRDIQVSSDLSSLELIAPETHQFSTIATSVPFVWLSTDHLSSVWCNQLVYVLSETLFDLIDPATKQDTYPLEDRMRIFKQQFQSKLPEALSFVDALPDLHRGTVQDTEKWIGRPYAEAFVHHHTITQTKPMKWHISENYHEYKFTMITGLPKESITAKLCKADFVDCLDLDEKITPVLHSVEPGVREFDTKIVPMNILVLMPDALKGYDYLLVEVQPPKNKGQSFFIAQWYGLAESRIVVDPPMFKEYMITLPKQHPIIVDFVFENLSKFQALSFKVERKECSTTIKQIADDLKSVVVQLNEETKEEKHSSLPITVIKYEICSQNKTQCFNNIHALLFSHPGCEYEIEISPNIFESLGQVFRGYLMLGIACCFAATFFIMFQQFRRYRKTGVYPSLWESLRDVHYNYVTVIFVIISFVDIVIGPIFTETVFTLTQEFLRHGLLTLPYPWPNLPILFMLHFLAISIVGIWYLAASLLYFVLTFRIGFRAQNEKSRPEKFTVSFVFVLYMLIVFGSFFFLHYSVTLIIALVYFLFSMKYYQNKNKWHFAQTLFVLYSFLLIIVIPSLVIWVKDLKYGWKWPDMEFAVLLIAIHVYVVRFLELPKGKSISYLMLLASAAVELACLHTVYRMMSVLIGVTLIFMTVPLFNKPSDNKDDNCNNRNDKKLGAKEDKKNDGKKLLKSKNNSKQSAKNNK